jgi:glycosyltransferase involved in cell wall biosynthesis
VTLAPSARDEVLASYGADPELVTVVSSGVEDRFSPGGVRDGGPLVVAVARLMPQKGVPDLLAAFALVRRTVPGARLVVVGAGPERDRLARTIVDLDLGDAVDLPGYATPEELVGWYRRAWVVASASHREGYGLTLLEAAACGTPSVARRIPGHVDAVVDGRTGLLADDVPGLAAALVALLTDADLRRHLGAAALEHAAGFRWEQTAQGILEALCDDADRRR